MRIGFLIPEFPQQTHVAWWRVSDAMRSEGAQVQLLSTRRPGEPCPHPHLVEAAQHTLYLWPPNMADVTSAPSAALLAPRWIRYLWSLRARRGFARLKSIALVIAALRLRRLARRHRLDHVFVHSCADAAHVVALSRLLGGPPYSLRLGGDLEVYGGDHHAKMALATLIVPAARSYEDRLVNEIGVARERIMWSWVGTDTARFAPGAPRSRSTTLSLITVARLNPAKGYQIAIPSLARLREAGLPFRYRIVGAGPFEPTIRTMIAEYGLQEQVELMGSQGADRIADLLREADVFVLPTCGIGEGTPAAVCEAMSAGMAVIATRVGGIADMITHEEHGLLVPPGDVDALFHAFVRLARDRELAARMGGAARQQAINRFDCRIVARRILDKIGGLQPPLVHSASLTGTTR